MKLTVSMRERAASMTGAICGDNFGAKGPRMDSFHLALSKVLATPAGHFLLTLKTRLLLLFLLLGLIAQSCILAFGQSPEFPEGSATSSAQTSTSPGPESETHGLSSKAVEIARPFNFPITNSMIVSWVVAIGLIVCAQVGTRNMQQIPSGIQNFVEWLVEGLYQFLGGIIGPHLASRTFWFFATIFIFILSANWMGLIPGVGAIGWGHSTDHGFRVEEPLLRGANADVNMTLAMALVFFACWIMWSLQEVGVKGFAKELFAPKGESEGALRILLIVVFFASGCLEIISILFRPISLSFRLYGNIFAGENLLESMSKLVPGFGWLVSIPFYFLELIMGLVQALVFMLLTAVFTMLMCQHESTAPAAAHS